MSRSELTDVFERLKTFRARAIIFCCFKSNCGKIKGKLEKHGIAAEIHHSGKTAKPGQWFTKGTVIVATTILVQGIDLPDVSRIIYHDIPGSLETLLQGTGRAGRTGQAATCTIYLGKKTIQDRLKLISRGRNPHAVARDVADLREVIRFCTEMFLCRNVMVQRAFGPVHFDTCQGRCDNCMHRSERLKKYARVDVSDLARHLLRRFRVSREGRPIWGEMNLLTWAQFEDQIKKSLKSRQQMDPSGYKKPPDVLLESVVLLMFQEGIFDILPHSRQISEHTWTTDYHIMEGSKSEDLIASA